jgi:hypothetical protein
MSDRPLPEPQWRTLAAVLALGSEGGSTAEVAALVASDIATVRPLLMALVRAGRIDQSGDNWVIRPAWDSNLWIELPETTPGLPDAQQRSVIDAPCEARLQVVAPPGHGKTWVLQQRVARLVSSGVDPSRILVISLTRVAVYEVRSRLEAAFGPNDTSLRGLSVRTLHSFAGRLLWDLGDTPDSYDATIKRLLDRIQRRDAATIERIAGFRHILVDEAQDLVGEKAGLVLALIGALPKESGWTVFCDPHQAIYDFEEGTAVIDAFVDRFRGVFPTARCVELLHGYRSSEPALRLQLAAARMLLTAGGPGVVRRMYDLAESRKSNSLVRAEAVLHPAEGAVQDALILHRSRSGALKTSYFLRVADHAHRMRMGSLARVVPPWVAAVLNEAFAQGGQLKVKRPEFDEAFATVAGQYPQLCADIDSEAAWHRLLHASGLPAAKVLQMDRVADAVLRGAADDAGFGYEPGSFGPVVGTVHGSKGREADRVLLYLPGKYMRDQAIEADEAAEARVIYVAMSRARRQLIISAGANTADYQARDESPRRWMNGTSPELGLQRDIDPLRSAERSDDAGQATLATYQRGAFRQITGRFSDGFLDFFDGDRLVASSSLSAFHDLRARDAARWNTIEAVVHDVGTAALPREGLSSVAGAPGSTRLILVPVLTGVARWRKPQ